MRIFLLILSFFIFSSYLAYPSTKVKVIKDQINVRYDSTPRSKSLGQLFKGEELEVVGEKFGWLRIRLPQRFSCYVSARFIKMVGREKGEVTASVLNLRNGPSLDDYILGTAKKGTILPIRGISEGWYEVNGYPYMLGWVYKLFTKELDHNPSPEKQVIKQESIEEKEQIVEESSPMVLSPPVMDEKGSSNDY